METAVYDRVQSQDSQNTEPAKEDEGAHPVSRLPRVCRYLCQLSEVDLHRARAAIEMDKDYLDYRDAFGKTALHYAVRANAPTNLIESLVKRGMDVNAADRDGWTPLHLFLRLHKSLDPTLGNCLLHLGASAAVKDGAGEDAVLKSVAMHVPATFLKSLLIEGGGDASTSNPEGETPLIIAAKSQSLDVNENLLAIVRLLVEHGANPLKKDLKGKSALDWSREKSNDPLVKTMRQSWYNQRA